MKRGDNVRQILPAPITGYVDGFSVDQETGDKLVHVTDKDGQGRFFKESELEVVPEPTVDEDGGQG